MGEVGAAAPWPPEIAEKKDEDEGGGGRREFSIYSNGEGVVCEGGPAAPTAASSAALRRLWRRSLRREEREIETEGWGRRGDVG